MWQQIIQNVSVLKLIPLACILVIMFFLVIWGLTLRKRP